MKPSNVNFAAELLQLLQVAMAQGRLTVGEHLLEALEAWVQDDPDGLPALDHAYLSLMQCGCRPRMDRSPN